MFEVHENNPFVRAQYYIVEEGDTLENLANEFEVSVDSLVKLNADLSLDDLMVGQKIRVK